MALSGWSTSNFIRLSAALASGAPLTLAAWAKTSVTSTNQKIVGIYNSAGALSINQYNLAIGGGDALQALTADGSGNSVAASSTMISASTWFHGCAVFASNTSRTIYLDGAGAVTETTSRVPSGLNRTSIGVRDNTSDDFPFAPGGTGAIAEVGIWSAALTADEVGALAKGFSPQLVRPQSLVAYLPLVRNLIDLRGNAFAIQGSLSQADHCRVYNPGA